MSQTLPVTTILLVESDISIVLAIKRIVEQRGYHVLVAHDGQKAWRVLQESSLLPHLIFLSLDPYVGDSGWFRSTQLRDPALRSIPAVALFGGTVDPRWQPTSTLVSRCANRFKSINSCSSSKDTARGGRAREGQTQLLPSEQSL